MKVKCSFGRFELFEAKDRAASAESATKVSLMHWLLWNPGPTQQESALGGWQGMVERQQHFLEQERWIHGTTHDYDSSCCLGAPNPPFKLSLTSPKVKRTISPRRVQMEEEPIEEEVAWHFCRLPHPVIPWDQRVGSWSHLLFCAFFWSTTNAVFVALLQKLCFMTFICQGCAVSTCQEETDSLPSDIQIRDAVGISHLFAVVPNLSRTGTESQVSTEHHWLHCLMTFLEALVHSNTARLEKALCSLEV